MAITKAQQARQMLKRGSKKPVKQAGATNYLGKQEMVTAPKFWLSEPGHVKAKLAYITDEEEKILIDKNLYGSLKGKPNIGPAGLPSLQGGDFGAGGGGQGPDRDGPDKPGAQAPAGGASAGGDYGGNVRADQTYGEREFKDQSYASQESINRAIERQKQRDKAAAARAAEIAKEKAIKEKEERQKKIREEQLSALGISTTTKFGTPTLNSVIEERKKRGAKRILEQIPGTPEYEEAEKDDIASGAIRDLFVNDPKTRSNLGIGTLKALEPILDAGAVKTRGFFADDVTNMDPKRFEKNFGLTPEEFRNASLTRKNEIYGRYMDDRLSNRTDAFGNPIGGRFRDSQGNIVGGRDGPDNQPVPQATPTTTGSVTPEEEEVDNRTEFEKLLASRPGAFRFFADGGMADDDDPVGGIMDLESGRQMYFLGKLVKKATKTIKKIAKSPVGKAAILGGLAYFGGGGGLPKLLGGKGLGGFSAKTFFSKANPLLFTKDKLSLGKLAAFSAASPFLFPAKQEEEEQEPYLGPSIDIPAIRRDPYGAMGGAYSFYAEGGKAEPVAKKTMPLLDMDGMEKDYRETGGFVEMGRMERADDVPARLSKNEFVFTADAVRNAGDGNIDKGAEVMYNMMKNLEAGGEVSEESQGLEGARKMFQTSQRLGEVI
jgi:hypothetical protein